MTYSITIISVSDGGIRYLKQSIENLEKDERIGNYFTANTEINLFYVGGQDNSAEKLKKMEICLLNSNIVLLDLMGVDKHIQTLLDDLSGQLKGDLLILGSGTETLRSRMKLGSFSLASMAKMGGKKPGQQKQKRPMNMQKMMDRMETVGKMLPIGFLRDMRNWVSITRLWHYAGPANCRSLLLLICKEYGKLNQLPSAGKLVDYSKYVLFDPEKLRGFQSMNDLKRAYGWENSKKTVGLLFYNHNYPNDAYPILAQICERLKSSYNVVPLGIGTDNDKYAKIKKLFKQGLTLDVLWDFLPFRFGAGPMGGNVESGLEIFRAFNTPILHPFMLGKHKQSEWRDKLMSLNPMQVIIHFMLPELDGVVDTMPIAATKDDTASEVEDLQQLQIIEDRLKKFLLKTKNYIRLKTTPNREKRVAFILYNYPPGEANVGGGAFLDTFCSMEHITTQLVAEGYHGETFSAKELEEVLMNGGGCNSAKWNDTNSIRCRYDVNTHIAHQQKVNCGVMMDRISDEWGQPPGDIMTESSTFLIPGLTKGNIFIGLQPTRGTFENPDQQYHDKDLPPHHQYLAYYSYLENEFKADVVIHVGTHGSIEFLPGKENAMSEVCYPDYLIGAMPHLYLYYSGNPSEATIAKRRTHGCMITYSGPAFMRSGSYGDYTELEDMIHEYAESAEIAPQKRAALSIKITEKANEMRLIIDGDVNPDNISSELIRLKSELVPRGLHTIGKSFEPKDMQCFLNGILSWKRGEIASLQSILAPEIKNLTGVSKACRISTQDEVFQFSEDLIQDYYFGKKQIFKSALGILSKKKGQMLKETLKFGETCLERIKCTDEIQGLLKGLEAGYVEARLGGDIIRDPEVFPTGYNIFQFDARLVPTNTAMERGREIAEGNINVYLKEKKRYPQSVTVVLWGLETSRTKGETLGQVLGLMGVRLKPSNDVWNKKIEVIPLAELGRPRIDCLMTICGFFRDMFPNMIEFLDDVYETISSLDETHEENFIRKHRDQMFDQLKKEMDEETAKLLSRSRIFGPPEGQYGTGITTMIESKNWKDEFEIAEAYLSSQKHIYNRHLRGEANSKVFEANLKNVDIVSQVRSSVDYSFTDLDHYYEYFGGLAKSVEKVKGEKPMMLVSDSSTSTIFTDEVQKAIELGVRSRLLNPDYVNEMLKHHVHGAQQITKRVENLIGLAATTGKVDSWVFAAVKKTFVDNQENFNKLTKNNKFSARELLEKLFEAKQRGYYNISEKEMEEMKEKYLELEGQLEDISEIKI